MSTVPKTDRSSQTTVAVSSAGPFLLGFRLYDVDGILVYVNGIQRFDWTLSADFTDGVATDASITFSSALSVSDEIIIDASLAPWREEDLINGDRNLVQKLNVELGRVWSSLSEIRRDAMRAVRGFAAIPPVGDVDLLNIAQAETYANEAAASAASAAADAALAQSAQENLYDNYAGAWQNATNYTRGQWVQDGGSSYLCIANHTSLGALNRPGLGSGWASYWALFAAKGSPGAGTGDVVAANAGSEYVSVAGAFRNNISAMLRAITKRTGLDLATDTTIDSSIYNSDGTNTNGPSGNADGDSFVSSKIDNSTYNYLWFGNARAWLGRRVADVNTWVELATKAYVDSKGMPAPNFESSEITLVSDGDFSVAHSLGAVPNLVIAVLVCKTANLGYAVGDELVLAGNSGTNTGVTWAANGTNIVGSIGSQIPVNAIGKTSGNITYANWKLVLRAWL